MSGSSSPHATASLGCEMAVFSKSMPPAACNKFGGIPPENTMCMCKDLRACSSVHPNAATGTPNTPGGLSGRTTLFFLVEALGGVPMTMQNTFCTMIWKISVAATGTVAKIARNPA